MHTNQRLVRACAQRRGSALVMVAFAATVLATLSFSILAISMAGNREQRDSTEQIGARYVCEAGLAEAVFELSMGNSGAVGSKDAPLNLDNATYWVEATDLGGQQTQLVATGEVDRAGECIELTVQAVTNNIFQWGAFGDESMSMDSNAIVDSYDSTLGTYDSQQVNGSGSSAYANANGDVGSNQDVTLEQNVKVWGDALPGPGGVTTGASKVSGSTAPMSEPVDLPPIDVPVIASIGSLSVPSATPMTVASGNYHYDDFEVETGGSILVTGPATIVFENFHLNSNSKFMVDASAGPVDVYVMGDFIFDSNTLMAPTDFLPIGLSINLLSDNVWDPSVEVQLDILDFNSNAKLFGTVYAPNTIVDIDSNFELFGSLVARQVSLDSNSRVHYDESLASASALGDVTYDVICWRTLAYQP